MLINQNTSIGFKLPCECKKCYWITTTWTDFGFLGSGWWVSLLPLKCNVSQGQGIITIQSSIQIQRLIKIAAIS